MLSHFQTDITLFASPNTPETLAVDAVPLPTKFQPTNKLGLDVMDAIVVVVLVDVVVVANLVVLVEVVVVVLVVLPVEELLPVKFRVILYRFFS